MGEAGFEVRRYEAGIDHVLFVMGWGNDFESPGIKWFISGLNEANLSVVAVRIPVQIKDHMGEIVKPVRELHDELDGPTVIFHSFGTIAGRYIEAKKRIFSSPYWGFPKHREPPMKETLLNYLGWIGLPLVPRGYGKEELGDLTMDQDMLTIPERISLKTISEIWKAMQGMAPLREDDKIYYSRSDRIVDLDPIEKAQCIRVRYDGGHQFFTSGSRNRVMKDLLYDLRS
jgi:hypothetical protein